jgi:hypothetical protein
MIVKWPWLLSVHFNQMVAKLGAEENTPEVDLQEERLVLAVSASCS